MRLEPRYSTRQPAFSSAAAPARFLPTVRARLAADAIPLPLKDYTLLAPLALAYLYRLGQADRNHSDGASWGETARLLVEGGISAALIQSVPIGYAGLALAATAYDVGHAENRADRRKAMIRSAITFPVGYIGAHIGYLVTDHLHRSDANTVLDTLARTPPGYAGKIDNALRDLGHHAQAYLNVFQNATPGELRARGGSAAITARVREFIAAQERFVSLAGRLTESDRRGLTPLMQRELKDLASRMGKSRAHEFIRFFNPAFGYLLAVGAIGLPLSAWLGKKFFGSNPYDHHGQSLPIMWLNRFISVSNGHEEPFDARTRLDIPYFMQTGKLNAKDHGNSASH